MVVVVDKVDKNSNLKSNVAYFSRTEDIPNANFLFRCIFFVASLNLVAIYKG